MVSPTSDRPATRCTLSDRVRNCRYNHRERTTNAKPGPREIRFPYQPTSFRRTARSQGMTVISVIVGSTREGRFSEKPAKWILDHLKKRDGVDARLLDLRDFPMPFFDRPL